MGEVWECQIEKEKVPLFRLTLDTSLHGKARQLVQLRAISAALDALPGGVLGQNDVSEVVEIDLPRGGQAGRRTNTGEGIHTRRQVSVCVSVCLLSQASIQPSIAFTCMIGARQGTNWRHVKEIKGRASRGISISPAASTPSSDMGCTGEYGYSRDVSPKCHGCTMGPAASIALTIDEGQVRVALRSANDSPRSGDRRL